MSEQQSNKPHREGTKKTTAKKKLHQNGQNKKAFAVNNPRKLERMAKRTHDMNEKKYHVPMIDRTPDDDPPPVVVAVVGPPGTGKSTLIKSLVRRLTKHTLTEIKGPITVVSGKRRRLTFIEVSNDLNSMVDSAKIADLVLLLVDGNFGLEMETMEFLNIAQHHGMPRVLGVVSHLDLFKSQSTLRTSKKRLKHRFWTEVYQGAKLFYLSGVINGRYPDREILNLSRFISVMKFRPLKWRNEHPYMLADRMTDLTHPEHIEQNPKCDRKVALYGYLHGTPLPYSGAKVHIAGVGDLSVDSIEKLPDPCPTPYFEQKLEELERERNKQAMEQGEEVARTTRRRKRLEDKQKIIYAPMSDVGGVFVEKDAVYIDIGDKESFVTGSEAGEGEKMVTDLQEVKETMSERYENGPGLKLFSTSEEIKNEPEPLDTLNEDEIEDEINTGDSGRQSMRRVRIYPDVNKSSEQNDSDLESESDVEGNILNRVRESLNTGRYDPNEVEYAADSSLSSDDEESYDVNNYEKMASKLSGAVKKKWDLNKLIYMKNVDPKDALMRWRNEDDESEENIKEEEESFFTKKTANTTTSESDDFLPSYPTTEVLKKRFNPDVSSDDEYENGFQILKSRFLVAPKVDLENNGTEGDEDEEVYDDFEDLEDDKAEGNDENVEESDLDASEGSFADFGDQEDKSLSGESAPEDEQISPEEQRMKNAAKKAQLKVQFEEEEDREFGADDPEGATEAETWYDFQKNKMAKQLDINKSEYGNMDAETRLQIEGYKAGSYVKIVFNKISYEFVENFSPEYPVVVGGLLPTETRFGIMNVRIRRHRWHKKILKSQDPLILSLGWRRFQTLPIYTTSDSRTRNRMLKYTPEHAYCFASFYGPLAAPNTTFVGFNIVDSLSTTGSFRIAATGIIEDLDSSVEIVKKLKLVGYPHQIFKNTAFVKDMFSNSLEVAKFEGAAIKTVSGIRGEIKRALSKPDGYFRATFEDKILMSDVIFLKTWYPVKVKKFYNPVSSLLLRSHSEWKGMRLTGQVRADEGISTPANPNSAYSKIERTERKFNPLRVPKSIKETLPFKSQIHEMKPQKKLTYMSKRAVVLGGEEKKARDLIQKISTLKKDKDNLRKEKKNEKFKDKLKVIAKKEELRKEKEKERKKEYFMREGKKRFSASGGGSNKRRNV